MLHRSFVSLLVVPGILMLAGCPSSHGAGTEPERDSGSRGTDVQTTRDAVVTEDNGRVIEDGGSIIDAAIIRPPGECSVQDATQNACNLDVCNGPDLYYWNGDSCSSIDCGTCIGDDCGRGANSEEECLALRTTCIPTLCQSTGGTWRFWANDCGYVCGFPSGDDCAGGPACDCGYPRTFIEGVGCMEDPACPAFEFIPPAEVCVGTGGEWGPFCSHSECGERSLDPCVNDACHCPATQVFDELRGCVDATRCFERRPGQSCDERSRCSNGFICCNGCGAGPCPPTCMRPMCTPDGDADGCPALP